MNKQTMLGAMGALALFISQGLSSAQNTLYEGTYTFEFEGDVAVWDVSGTYYESLDDIDMTFTLNVDSMGKITGSGNASAFVRGLDENGDLVEVNLDADVGVTGTIAKSGATTRVTLNIKMAGLVNVNGKDNKFSATANAKTILDTIAHEMTGSVSVKVSAAGRSGGGKTEFELPLESDIDGSWTVSETLGVDGKGLISGTGKVLISGGQSFSFAVTGSYSAKKALATLSLKGQDLSSAGVSLKMTVQPVGATLNLRGVTGSLLGQKVARK